MKCILSSYFPLYPQLHATFIFGFFFRERKRSFLFTKTSSCITAGMSMMHQPQIDGFYPEGLGSTKNAEEEGDCEEAETDRERGKIAQPLNQRQ